MSPSLLVVRKIDAPENLIVVSNHRPQHQMISKVVNRHVNKIDYNGP